MVMPHNVLERSLNRKVSLLLKDSRVLDGKLEIGRASCRERV